MKNIDLHSLLRVQFKKPINFQKKKKKRNNAKNGDSEVNRRYNTFWILNGVITGRRKAL